MTAAHRQPILRCNAALPESREAVAGIWSRYGHHPFGLYGKHQVNVSTGTGLCLRASEPLRWNLATILLLAGRTSPWPRRGRVNGRTSQRRVSVVQPCGLCPSPHQHIAGRVLCALCGEPARQGRGTGMKTTTNLKSIFHRTKS